MVTILIYMQNEITERYNMTKTLKAEYLPGGAKRQFILDKAVKYLQAKLITSQADRKSFLMDELKLTSTEYLEALNKATNGGVVESAWN